MSDLKPGLYKATVMGEENVLVFVPRTEEVGRGHVAYADIGRSFHVSRGDLVTDARPLIVLDLCGFNPSVMVGEMRECLPVRDSFAWPKIIDQIEEQTKPPCIPEPGQWGVVDDHDGFTWIRDGGCVNSSKEWICSEDGSRADWSDLADPVLVREGVRP